MPYFSKEFHQKPYFDYLRVQEEQNAKRREAARVAREACLISTAEISGAVTNDMLGGCAVKNCSVIALNDQEIIANQLVNIGTCRFRRTLAQ